MLENPLKAILDASAKTAEPKRAERNLLRLFDSVPDAKPYLARILDIAKLFASSQFLANFSAQNPEALLTALKEMGTPLTSDGLVTAAEAEFAAPSTDAKEMMPKEIMLNLRLFKKRYLLRATLRDVCGMTDVVGSMDELTLLSEVVIRYALESSLRITSERFGDPPVAQGESCQTNGLSLIAVGKLGGEELNYSSDVDLIAAYGSADGQTSGVISPSGVRLGRISTHEYYVKAVELFSRLLTSSTEDGIAYRVDLRLRPQGQKGEIALPIDGFRSYYESWGRTWERMVLIRARPVAGDAAVGNAFMDAIRPFVWRSSVDYSEVEAIRAMKKKIDSAFLKDDIKRGYGGIREAEFFVQTFQLIYGGQSPALRTHRLSGAIEALRGMALIPDAELTRLWENYLYLRRLEHYLQMMDDLQTHSLPPDPAEVECLARRLGYPSGKGFLSDLRGRRMEIKSMYNSLLGTKEDIHAEALSLLEGEVEDEELSASLAGFLSFKGVRDTGAGLQNLKRIRERLGSFKTPKEREHLRRAAPGLLEEALRAASPDRALAGLERLFTSIDVKEAHLEGLAENRGLTKGVMGLLSLSPYLTRVFLSDPAYLNFLIEESPIRKTQAKTGEEIERVSLRPGGFQANLLEYKNMEELRLGMYFLAGIIKTPNLLRYLSHLADSVIGAIAQNLRRGALPPFSVIAMGKLGGREITYGSDLDLVFFSKDTGGVRQAEAVIKALSAYTPKGVLYEIDMRLRPDGSKGVLVKDIGGFAEYYGKSARLWELQALLKARPVAGDCHIGRAFMDMAKRALSERGGEAEKEEISAMRKKIVEELSSKNSGEYDIDIKLAPGGIEEIEFHLQWLALKNCREHPDLIVQNTPALLHRLKKSGLIKNEDADSLSSAYAYLRGLETLLRLNETDVIAPGSEVSRLASAFMGHKGEEEFLGHLNGLRERVLKVVG